MAQSSTLRVRRYVWYYADLEALRYMISTNCVTKEGYYLDIQNSLLINMVYLSERLYKLRSTKIKIYKPDLAINYKPYKNTLNDTRVSF